ncbi:MAG: ABC transporter ATP-binding protein/permease [Oscillospiraceae bacterium]|nr:ABC transporter ATP-binding protein/permease [Oscillospiraceae bacterium]
MAQQGQTADRPAAQAAPPSIGRPGGFKVGGMRFAETEKAHDAKGAFRKLLRFYFREAKPLFAVLVLLLLDMIVTVSAPYIIGRGIDALDIGNDLNLVYICAAALALAYLASWALTTAQGVIMNAASQRIVKTLRAALFDKLQRLPLTYHDTHPHGELMSRMTNDIDNISVTIAQSTTQLAGAVITVCGSLAMMLALSWQMTLAALVCVPLVFLLTKVVAGKSRKMFTGQFRALGQLNGLTEEAVGGQRVIKAFHMEKKIVASFDEINKDLLHYSTKAQIWAGILMPFMNVITNLGYAGVALLGGALAARGTVTVGAIGSFVTYARQFTFPLNSIAGMYNSLQSALAGAERVFELLEEPQEPEDAPDAIDIGVPKGEVRFEDVTFSYVPGVDVLKSVSFEVQAGQKVALVGATGAGKTTIVNLLARFYDANSGVVYIDGLDIKQYKRDSLRRAFSVVLQDTCLFTGIIADNIRYGRPEATDEEVAEAAKAANADAFIRRLRHGYETMVRGGSDSLSQGQRQLLAIARAALCRAPILILDEATSSVDTRTELRIQEALLRLTAGCTSFVIAHRLSTIRDADVIMVVEGGQIVESGSHEELLALGRIYARMYESQVAG